MVDGKTYYVHKQTVDFGKDTVNFGFQYCPEPPKIHSVAGNSATPSANKLPGFTG